MRIFLELLLSELDFEWDLLQSKQYINVPSNTLAATKIKELKKYMKYLFDKDFR